MSKQPWEMCDRPDSGKSSQKYFKNKKGIDLKLISHSLIQNPDSHFSDDEHFNYI